MADGEGANCLGMLGRLHTCIAINAPVRGDHAIGSIVPAENMGSKTPMLISRITGKSIWGGLELSAVEKVNFAPGSGNQYPGPVSPTPLPSKLHTLLSAEGGRRVVIAGVIAEEAVAGG